MAQERGRPQGATVGSVLSVDVALDDWGSGVVVAVEALILSRFSEKPRRSCLDRGGRWPGKTRKGQAQDFTTPMACRSRHVSIL